MISLFKPFIPELPEILKILNSGQLSYGQYTLEFENSLKKYFNTKYVIVTNSFENAINVATTAVGMRYGDEVIMSPMSCLSSTQPYLTAGYKIKWADIDPEYGTLDPDSVEKKISKKTKAIIHNHFCGYPGYIDEINEICKKYCLTVIDDGIECFGSKYKGKLIGNCGTDITIFSFSAIRIPNTIEGGAIIFKDEQSYRKSLMIRDHGIDREKFRDELGEINPNCDITQIGYSAMMSNVNAYIGVQQMKYLDELLFKQRKNAKILDDIIKKDTEVKQIVTQNCNPNFWVYGILAKNKVDTIIKYRNKGFYASGVHINNDIYSVFGEKDHLPGTNDFNKCYVALPSGWWVDSYDNLN